METWGEGAWNEAVPVRVGHTLNGWGEEGFGLKLLGAARNQLVAAMQGQVGTVVVREDVSTSVTGLECYRKCW